MRYLDFRLLAFYLAAIMLVVMVAGCGYANWTPEQKAQFNRDVDAWGCANSLAFGSISTMGDRQFIPHAQAMAWCEAMQRGQPYVSPQVNVAPSYRAPVYDCDRVGNTVECRPR